MITLLSTIGLGGLVSASGLGVGGTVSESARTGIDAGNQAWIDGMKAGSVAQIIATYSADAVDCDASGECCTGRYQIERRMTAQMAQLGSARSASVESLGATQQGNFVYEWGRAQATSKEGKTLIERYLTVWKKQPDGSWKIFRNLVIPQK